MCRLSVAVQEARRADEPLWQRAAGVWLAQEGADLRALPESLRWQIEQSGLLLGCSAYGWRKAISCEHCLPPSSAESVIDEHGYWSHKPQRYAVPADCVEDYALHRWLALHGLHAEYCLLIWQPCSSIKN